MGTNKDKEAHRRYMQEYRLRTGRTKQIGQISGERHHSARLTEADRIELLKLKRQGWTNVALAAHFGVNESSIRKLLKRLQGQLQQPR